MKFYSLISQVFKKHTLLILVIFLSLLYLFTLRGLPGNLLPEGNKDVKIITNSPPFESSQERGRFAQLISLVHYSTFNVDRFTEFVRPDLAWYNGHYYPAFPPGIVVLDIPFYLVGHSLGFSQIFSFLISILFGILSCVMIFKIGEQLNFSLRSRIISVLAYSIASVAWAYTVTLSVHTLSAFLITSAFYLFIKIKINNKRNLFYLSFLWLITGFNFFIDYPNFIILIPILIGSHLKLVTLNKFKGELKIILPTKSLFTVVFVLIGLFIFIFYSLKMYGIPLAFTNKYNIKVLQNYGVNIDKKNLNNELFSKYKYSNRFSFKSAIKGSAILTISTDRGLFFYSPIFIFSLLGVIIAIKKRYKWAIIICLCFIADMFLYASFDDPWGGWAFGPRYLIPTIPLISILVGLAFNIQVYKSILLKILFTFVFVYSVSISLIGALTTNAVPPSIEAPYVNLPSNFLLNFNYLNSGKTSSFIYNIFNIKKILSPNYYYLIILIVVSIIGIILIWSAKKYDKN